MTYSSFLMVQFTQVTLEGILYLLGIPYLIFYIFEKITKFDKFPEKWEAGLFIFTSGSIIVETSSFLAHHTKLEFLTSYLLMLLIFIIILSILFIISPNKKKIKKTKSAIMIQLKDGTRYKGFFYGENKNFIQLSSKKNQKIEKIKLNKNNIYDKPIKIKYKILSFNIDSIDKIIT